MAENLHFKVSSGLKDIIGRELINNKYIAIFELVKNSYDAQANTVTIRFVGTSSSFTKIVITDDGYGMNKSDIINKWLFVAYSEKKSLSHVDNIQRRNYAGAKGVGRFSCDRLGTIVNLISKKKEDEIAHKITINWKDFEADEQEDFKEVNVKYQEISDDSLIQGTIIEILDLREDWSRSDILSLKKALSQLVNPNATIENDKFDITIEAPRESDLDAKQKEDRDKVNGVIKNYVFETLNIKTTKVTVKISEDGKTIETLIEDRGMPIISLTEKSPYSLKNIEATVYHLNRKAKVNFKRIMGIEVVNYGSVFIYKNGFRVYPYGEPNTDFFNIDRRKAQGFKRYLGTRDIVGHISIIGNHNQLIETSSRNNGFIISKHSQELIDYFIEYCLKPLEKYVINILSWNESEKYIVSALDGADAYQFIKKIKPQTKKSNIIEVDFNENLLKSENKEANRSIVAEIREIAINNNNSELFDKIEQVEKHTLKLQEHLIDTEQEREMAQSNLEIATKELSSTQNQVKILAARADLTADDAVSALHIMKGYADTIDLLTYEIQENIKYIKDANQVIKPFLSEISRTCIKMINSYNLVLSTNYSANNDVATHDIVKFVRNYVNISTGYNINISIKSEENFNANVRFNPLEFSIIVDNIILNSVKANAYNLSISFEDYKDYIIIRFTDDGIGLSPEITDYNKIFEPGFTTTSGTGIGLQTVKKYVEKIDGNVKYNETYAKGFELEVKLYYGSELQNTMV